MSNTFTEPPKKRSRPEQSQEDFSDSDDSFDDPVLAEPSQITQNILQRREAGAVSLGSQQRAGGNYSIGAPQRCSTPLGHTRDEHDLRTSKPFLRQCATSGRFTVQDKNDYHQNGQLLMLRNRVENMEREKERLAAATRDQIILKEKHHAAELLKKDERIRQLETQVQSLRRENLQTSFQAHNVTLGGNDAAEMVDGSVAGQLLPMKRVVFPRHDIRWKTALKFGAGASVFAPSSSTDRFEVDTGAETFTNIPSQVLMENPVSNLPLHNGKAIEPAIEKVSVADKNNECHEDTIADFWNVQKWMCESSLESLLNISLFSQESNFDPAALSKLCQVKDFLDLKRCLRPRDNVQ
ncbi:hypothetical protein KIN20_003592 [Parelaphostrongylus tenuis]|uniref:Uncharacterized protein n=1 Tax=Parelaphostrongylus tenuis TaxID=148309 RepID=A0AAD5MII4_PARTN|nr:hypothetical protein KIN20_003592 [Parelaphostrongylus tenuis]